MYSYEWIERNVNIKQESGGHFRIRDKKDNAIAFCYCEENAKFLVNALNHYTANETV